MFENILGNDKIKKELIGSINNEKYSHSYLFLGISGIGKKMIAKEFAKMILCGGEKKYCNKCKSCIEFSSGNNPDFAEINPDGNNVKIEQIRELQRKIVEPPIISNKKVYIIDEAEKMNVAAQNAILKTIEEPPEYAIIFLLTTNRGAFLDTILSRCILLETKPVSGKMIERYLGERYKIPEEEAEFAAGFSLGNIGKAEAIVSSEEFQDLKELTLDILRYIHEIESYEIADKVKEYKKYKARIDDFFDIFLMWFRDILLLKADTSPNKDIARRKIIFKNEYISLKKQADKLKMDSIDYIINRINHARIRIKSNVNFDATLELLIVEARREF